MVKSSVLSREDETISTTFEDDSRYRIFRDLFLSEGTFQGVQAPFTFVASIVLRPFDISHDSLLTKTVYSA